MGEHVINMFRLLSPMATKQTAMAKVQQRQEVTLNQLSPFSLQACTLNFSATLWWRGQRPSFGSRLLTKICSMMKCPLRRSVHRKEGKKVEEGKQVLGEAPSLRLPSLSECYRIQKISSSLFRALLYLSAFLNRDLARHLNFIGYFHVVG